MDYRTELLSILHKHAFQYRPAKPFTLASGRLSPTYLDCKTALSLPQALAVLGPLVVTNLQRDITAVGGLTMGADPIAISASMASAGTPHPVKWFSIRKKSKDHGTVRYVEGNVKMDERVSIVEDVLTSGKSTIQAIGRCLEEGLDVAQVIVLIDRQEGDGLAKVKHVVGETVPVTVLFTLEDIAG